MNNLIILMCRKNPWSLCGELVELVFMITPRVIFQLDHSSAAGQVAYALGVLSVVRSFTMDRTCTPEKWMYCVQTMQMASIGVYYFYCLVET